MEWRTPENALGRTGRVAGSRYREDRTRELCATQLGAFTVQRLILVALFVVVTPMLARSTRVAPMSAEQVLARADLIIVASIKGIDCRWSESGKGMAITDYSLLIDRVLFARDGMFESLSGGSVFQLSFGGGEIDGRKVHIPGVPVYVTGEQVILFVDRDEMGTISPLVGMSAGDYRVSVASGQGGIVVGPTGIVKRGFFSESDDMASGFTLDSFIDEVRRALPIAQADPTLLPEHDRAQGASETKAYTGSEIPRATPLGAGVTPVPSQGTVMPAHDTTKPANPNEN